MEPETGKQGHVAVHEILPRDPRYSDISVNTVAHSHVDGHAAAVEAVRRKSAAGRTHDHEQCNCDKNKLFHFRSPPFFIILVVLPSPFAKGDLRLVALPFTSNVISSGIMATGHADPDATLIRYICSPTA